MDFLCWCGGVDEPSLFKLTVIQHPAKSQAHNSATVSVHMALGCRGKREAAHGSCKNC